MIAVSSIMLASCGHSTDAHREPSLVIHYLPFDIETLTPVTTSDMGGGDGCRLPLASELATRILSILDSSGKAAPARTFDGKRVRAQIVEIARSKRVLAFVDAEGVVRRGEVDGALTAEARDTLKGLLDQACGYTRP